MADVLALVDGPRQCAQHETLENPACRSLRGAVDCFLEMRLIEATGRQLNAKPFEGRTQREELGFVGTLLAITAFAFVLWRLVRLAERSHDPFAGLVLLGIFGAWLVHVFVNVGMTVGLVPITGIPLPFVSYGGTFLFMCWVAVAIAVRVANES